MAPSTKRAAASVSAATWSSGGGSGSGGYHNLTGGHLIVQGASTIGYDGVGQLTIDGGVFEQSTPGTLFMVGATPFGYGSVKLISGSLRILGNEEKIGGDGTGYFYQSGGAHQFAGGLYVGDVGYGEYHMLGGSLGPVLDSGGNPVAYAGIVMGEWAATGKFFHSGGMVDVDSVVLARQAGSTGLYEMSGDSAELMVNWMNVGERGGGSFVQGAGVVRVGGDLNLGVASGVIGNYTISGGELNTQVLRIGESGHGEVQQTGGVVNIASTSGFSILVMAENPGSSGTYTLSGGILNAERVFVGDSDAAQFNQSGGEHIVGHLALGIYKDATQHGQGTYQLSGGVLASGMVVVGAGGSGSLLQSGGLHFNGRGIVLGEQAGSLGRYELSGGELMVARDEVFLINGGSAGTGQGEFIFSGDGLFSGTLLNRGQTLFSGPVGFRMLEGNVINAETGSMKAENARVAIRGLLQNDGAYLSSGSSLNAFIDLWVTETGYLVGGPGDQFLIEGRFESYSTQNTLWDTQNAQLIFIGDTSHEFWITGADLGATMAGYSNNFGWGDLQLYDTVLILRDGNGTPGGALYVGTLSGLVIVDGDTIHNIHGNGLNIYYAPWANPSLEGKTYLLMDGGLLAPVPEPETWAMLLAGLGLVGWVASRRKKA